MANNGNKNRSPFKGWKGRHSKVEYSEWSIDTVNDGYPDQPPGVWGSATPATLKKKITTKTLFNYHKLST